MEGQREEAPRQAESENPSTAETKKLEKLVETTRAAAGPRKIMDRVKVRARSGRRGEPRASQKQIGKQ